MCRLRAVWLPGIDSCWPVYYEFSYAFLRVDAVLGDRLKTYDPHAAKGLSGALLDMASGLMKAELWFEFAKDEIQHRFRRSLLGVSWLVVSFAMFVAGVAYFFSGFASMPMDEFVFHVAIGYAAYLFIIGNLIDGCEVFTSSKIWIKAMPLPYSIHVYRSITRSVLALFMQFIIIAVLMIIYQKVPSITYLLAIPALLIYVLNAVFIQFLLGLVAARHRDLGHLVTSISRLLIFVTPILWSREGMVGQRAFIADLNPLTHYVEILRAPLMGVPPRLTSWITVIAITIVSGVVTLLVAAVFRRRLPYWL